ncbi:anti-repressor SinI family protein [Halalkalibacter akibai]|nr:anti-repressor SinI family protein [Halalkalibacter akibai]
MIVSSKEENMKAMDLEWVELLLEAKQLGLTPEEVKEFILHTKKANQL